MASHFSFIAASTTLAGAMLIGAIALRFVPDVRPFSGESLAHRVREMGCDLLDLLRTPMGLLRRFL